MSVSRSLPILAALLLGACSNPPSAGSEASPPITAKRVDVVLPSRGEASVIASGIGRLKADNEAALAFTTAGVIASIDVDIGERVRVGQVLARLDSTVLDAAAREAGEQVAQAKRDVARAEGLVARQLVAGQQLDNAKTGLEVAEARLRAARFGQRFGRIVAATDGAVLARLAEPGEVVAAGQPVLRVSGDASGWVLPVTLADRDGLRVRPGASAEVRFDAVPGVALPAVVKRVAGEASATSGGIVIELAVAGQGVPLRSGLVGKARITMSSDGVGLRIPTSALLDADTDEARVFIVEKGHASLRSVRLGEVHANTVTVLDGLNADDAVVIGGAAFLAEGAPVVAESQR